MRVLLFGLLLRRLIRWGFAAVFWCATLVLPTTRAVDATPLRPDPALTPGAVLETHTAVICVAGYARAHRMWHDKVGTLAKYGITYDQRAAFEDDDLIPVCLGGDNADPRNHWLQPWPEARMKDALEVAVCRRICRDRDDTELARYQAAFAADWVALWYEVMGGE